MALTPSRSTIQLIRRRAVYSLLFFLGTVIAAIGWFAEWKNLGRVYPIFYYAGWIALVGHVLQVIAAFGNLLTPDAEASDRPETETPIFWKED